MGSPEADVTALLSQLTQGNLYPAAAVHRIRGALAAQAIFELAPPDVDVARTYATFRALSFVPVRVHRRRES